MEIKERRSAFFKPASPRPEPCRTPTLTVHQLTKSSAGLRALPPRPLVGFGRRRGLRGRALAGPKGGWDICPDAAFLAAVFADVFWSGWDICPSVTAHHRRCIQSRQRRAQRIKARRVRKSVAFDNATDCRCHRGQLVVGKVNCRHGPGYNRPKFVQQVEGRHASIAQMALQNAASRGAANRCPSPVYSRLSRRRRPVNRAHVRWP
jgi:hypothetical protein